MIFKKLIMIFFDFHGRIFHDSRSCGFYMSNYYRIFRLISSIKIKESLINS